MSLFLTILIAAAVVGYAVYLLVRMIRRPEKSCCGCGCGRCPMAGKCHEQKDAGK